MSNSNSSQPGDDTGVHLFNETSSPLPVNIDTAGKIVSKVEEYEPCHFRLVEIVFVDEEEIKAINRQYLRREYVTDIITFPYHEASVRKNIEGTLYCCAPRIYKQAENYDQSAKKEFKRVIIHGLLHLIGYDDQSEQDQKKMRRQEDFYLRKLHSCARL
jgi:rRNA maturation RNase YbeY